MGSTPTQSDRIHQTLRLPDGRLLGYAEYGAPQGTPVFYFHGWPSSRLEFGGLGGDEVARGLNVRVIAADRPGFGLSSFQPHHRFTDWPQDVVHLAGHLGLERFALLSYSAGSPYAAACAWAIPRRLSAVGIVSGLAQPFTAPGATKGMPTIVLWTTARIHPRLTWLLFNLMRNTIKNAPRDRLPSSAKQALMAEADFAFIREHPAAMASNMDSGAEALRQGGLGPAQAGALYWKPWGFRLEDIQIPVRIWHGEADLNAPFAAHGRVLAQRLPHAEATFYAHEGHISLIHRYLESILWRVTAYPI
jgi:pimeloyl-ACP methyl ester carboxylesterase